MLASGGFLLACGAITGLRLTEESSRKGIEARVATPDFFLGDDTEQVRVFVPEVYQDVDGFNRSIETHYKQQRAGEISFRLGPFDPSYPLQLDLLIQQSRLSQSQNSERITIEEDEQ